MLSLCWSGLVLLLLCTVTVSRSHADSVDDLAANSSLLWGSYRPNVYVGFRPRIPESLSFGLVWYGLHNLKGFAKARYACEQDDGITYAWTKHDGRSFGSQFVHDNETNVRLETTFLKVPGGSKGGSWAMRIRGTPIREEEPARLTMAPYFGLDGRGQLVLENEEDEEGIEDDIHLTGASDELGAFSITVKTGADTRPMTRQAFADDFGDRIDRWNYIGIRPPEGASWRAKEFLFRDVLTGFQAATEKYGKFEAPDPAVLFLVSNDVQAGATLFLLQRSYEAPFEFDVFYESSEVPARLDAASLTVGSQAASLSFDDRFETVFSLAERGYSPEEIQSAKELFASMLGGIGYFHGSSVIDRSAAPYAWDDDDPDAEEERSAKPRLTPPQELFTATPSRPFFPRGFYWDEGFHLMLIREWDNDLSLAILSDWINLIDDDGWVAREQILGAEARSKVPQEFWVQYPLHANPPTLVMPLRSFVAQLKAATGEEDINVGNADPHAQHLAQGVAASSAAERLASRHLTSPSMGRGYLRSIYPALRRHYNWFRRTQRGQVDGRVAGYRWRGRTPTHVLTSGLDDYPRASPPSAGELHLDLACWMTFFARTMADLAEVVGEHEDQDGYLEHATTLWAFVEATHWNEEEKMYCDVSVDEDDERYFVCHAGYITLFPLMLGLVPPSSPRTAALIDLLQDPGHLWSDYGIRSLSRSHPLFGKGENYWRGAIWLPMNYMILQALHDVYAREAGPSQQLAAQLYDELRNNIVQNVLKEYKRTGFAWEQYDGVDGKGRRSRPFTGWTSLLVCIMAERY